jgi:hypothetical protein
MRLRQRQDFLTERQVWANSVNYQIARESDCALCESGGMEYRGFRRASQGIAIMECGDCRTNLEF